MGLREIEEARTSPDVNEPSFPADRSPEHLHALVEEHKTPLGVEHQREQEEEAEVAQEDKKVDKGKGRERAIEEGLVGVGALGGAAAYHEIKASNVSRVKSFAIDPVARF